MTFEASLYAHLSQDAGIAALAGEEIFPVVNPRDTAVYPYITYARVSAVPQTDFDGANGNLINEHVQIDVWALTYDEARALADAVITRLATAASSFQSVVNFDQDLYEPETKSYRVLIDANCWFRTS